MTTNLKPVSDLERKMLALLGEDISKHQANMQLRLAGKKPEKHQDKVLAMLKAGNVKIKEEPTIQSIVAGLAEPTWIGDAYVIFIRHSTCKGCGLPNVCQHDTNLYLRQRPAKPDPSNPFLYTPVKEMANPTFRRLEVVQVTSQLTCPNCFQGLYRGRDPVWKDTTLLVSPQQVEQEFYPPVVAGPLVFHSVQQLDVG